MKVTSKTIRAATTCLFAIFVFGATLAAASTAEDVQEKTIASKRSGSLVVVMTNETGKLTPGENHFCVLFQTIIPSAAVEVTEVSVDFRLLVGRIEEAPLTAHLTPNGVQRFCGRIDLSRQYYRPANYYGFVHYIEANGRKRSMRLFVSVK